MASRQHRNTRHSPDCLALFDVTTEQVSITDDSRGRPPACDPSPPEKRRRQRARSKRTVTDQTRAPIFEEISSIAETRTLSFQTPGHTGGLAMPPDVLDLLGPHLFRMDVSVCATIDSLSHPTTFIRESEQLLAQAYGVKRSFFLVNGSTTGNLAMLMAALREGDQIILPRYVHRSILHALSLTRATPIWVANDIDPHYHIPLPLSPAQIAQAVRRYPEAKAVLVNTPTYHGLCCDIAAIAKIVHRAHKLLLVDEAWGAHLAFHDDFPASGAHYADLCVQSLHKTLPVTNQGAVLHCNSSRINEEYLANVLTMFQTTSPSYVLLSIMDVARREMALRGQDYMQHVLELAEYASRRINAVPGLSCLGEMDLPTGVRLDPVKLTIRINGRRFPITGYDLEVALCRDHQIQIEMSDPETILILLKPGVSREDIDHFVKALQQIRQAYAGGLPILVSQTPPFPMRWHTVLTPAQAFQCPSRAVPLSESVGRVSWDSMYAYPPGAPVVMPGECISREIIDYLQELMRLGAVVKGLTDRGEVLICEPHLAVTPSQRYRRSRRIAV